MPHREDAGMASRYHEVYAQLETRPRRRSGRQPPRAIDWVKPWDKVFDADAGVYGRWFAGAECNTCFNAVDRHVAGGRADQLALIHDSADHRHGQRNSPMPS